MPEDARTNAKWFAEVVPASALEESRREYIALYGEVAGQALYNQEYECSLLGGGSWKWPGAEKLDSKISQKNPWV